MRKQEYKSNQLTKTSLKHQADNLENKVWTKIRLNHQEVNLDQEINDRFHKLHFNNSDFQLFLIEKLGFFLILISGLMPFVHSFVEHKVLDEKIFGFSSVHLFLYSFGVHLGTFLLVIGVLLAVSVANTASRYNIIQNYLKYSLTSPFISGIFYLSWVFVPDVNYNLLAYIFLGLIISTISLLVFIKVLKYINTLKLLNKHKENVIKDGFTYLKSKLTKKANKQKV